MYRQQDRQPDRQPDRQIGVMVDADAARWTLDVVASRMQIQWAQPIAP